jgi:hypothetical protein
LCLLCCLCLFPKSETLAKIDIDVTKIFQDYISSRYCTVRKFKLVGNSCVIAIIAAVLLTVYSTVVGF